MEHDRRDLLKATAGLFATAGLAGCSGLYDDRGADGTAPGSDGGDGSDAAATGPTTDVAVAAEWTAMRARVADALAFGVAGETDAGAALAQDVFARFEGASGEYGAHEMLEGTSEEDYEGFEAALGDLRSAVGGGDVGAAREAATAADDALAAATRALVDDPTANALELQYLGVRTRDAATLAAAASIEAAGTVAGHATEAFEASPAYDAVESASGESSEAFEAGLAGVERAAGDGDVEALRARADEAFAAALNGSYAVADDEASAGAGHLAALQARGWDAAALASLGGPSAGYAHAAALTIYRARVADAAWLAAAGEVDRATTVVRDTFAHFEGARAHEALEEADGEAYEGFEAGLSELTSAIEAGDAAAVDEAHATVDENLVTGIGALAGDTAPLLEAGFFRARLADAYERYRLGDADAATATARGVFERFEANELDVHETVESTDEGLYERFEEEHLAEVIEAFEAGDDAGVDDHYEGATAALAEFATMAGSTATVSGVEAGVAAARAFDAAAVDRLGDDERAAAVVQATFRRFEAGAGGYHEALEAADESTYESFEAALGEVGAAASDGADVYPAATTVDAEAVASIYAIAGSAGGSASGAAAAEAQAVFAHFEEARVHELIEEADHNAYEAFEAALSSYVEALNGGGDVAAAAATFADAAQYGQFALVDGVEDLPLALRLAGTSAGGSGGEGGEGGDADLQGGPNVVEGVPDDADHVVEQLAVAFEPKRLTIQQGDTVAFPHAAGEAHTVFAYEDRIPEDAAYWASGRFESQAAAEEGWSDGKGAVRAGQSYVHTFETTGTHEYYCAPHEAAGMVGTVVVE